MRRHNRPERRPPKFVRICEWLEMLGSSMGMSANAERAATARKRGAKDSPWPSIGSSRRLVRRIDMLETLKEDLDLGELDVAPEIVLAAGKTLMALLMVALAFIALALSMFITTDYVVPSAIVALICPVAAWEAILKYPARRASMRAEMVLRSSSETANLMIMSLRHESSVSRAIAFASRRNGAFSMELRACTWGVIMGRYESFEEALMSLGQRWSRFGNDLKSSLNAMVTASRESTEDGRRRALDRANDAMIAGAKRRIEQYASSLSTPTMLIFGLGILLPIMVGSFVPMLSWNLWSLGGPQEGASTGYGHQTTVQMVIVMNVLFPTIAALVAMNAVSGHPLRTDDKCTPSLTRHNLLGLAVVVGAALAGTWACTFYLSGTMQSIGVLLSSVVPLSLWSMAIGGWTGEKVESGTKGFDDALFRTGARMLEGENFEAALSKTSNDTFGREGSFARMLSMSSTIMGIDEPLLGQDSSAFGFSNSVQGLSITRQAATKDEMAAGMLAMDLAVYLKDLKELENTLRNRLKPTISMMRTTALLLAPIVLGVTYAIFQSLGSMMENQGTSLGGELFLLVLGVFLIEMNIVVVYFMWGIEGKRGVNHLAFSIGLYVLVSEITFAVAAIMTSG